MWSSGFVLAHVCLERNRIRLATDRFRRAHKHMRPATHVRVHTQSTCASVALFRASATAVTSCEASGLFTSSGPSTGVKGSSSSAPLEEIAVAALHFVAKPVACDRYEVRYLNDVYSV